MPICWIYSRIFPIKLITAGNSWKRCDREKLFSWTLKNRKVSLLLIKTYLCKFLFLFKTPWYFSCFRFIYISNSIGLCILYKRYWSCSINRWHKLSNWNYYHIIWNWRNLRRHWVAWCWRNFWWVYYSMMFSIVERHRCWWIIFIKVYPETCSIIYCFIEKNSWCHQINFS